MKIYISRAPPWIQQWNQVSPQWKRGWKFPSFEMNLVDDQSQWNPKSNVADFDDQAKYNYRASTLVAEVVMMGSIQGWRGRGDRLVMHWSTCTWWGKAWVHGPGEKLKHVYLLGDKLDYMYLHRKWTLCDGDKNSPLDISFNILELWRFEDGRWVWITSVGERSVW